MAAAPQNRAHLAVKRDVIRKHLAQAVRLFSTEEFENFTFFKQLKKEDIEFNAFKFADGLDVNIQLPVSLQDIGSLKQHFINNASKPTAINLCTTPPKLDLSELVIQQLGLPFGLMNVQASPSQLILHDGQTRQKFCWPAISPVCDSKLVTGKVILQLPVEGGHEGGALKVDYNGRNQMFENDRSSDQCFYLSAFYNFCNDVIEPLKKGYKLTLVFNLVWTSDNAIDIKGIPVFLTALKKTKTTLAAWLNPNPLEDLQLTEKDNRYKQCDSSESDEFENFRLSNETLSDDVLFFVLEENYGENDLAFRELRGKDRILVQILQSCNIVDVHLACAALISFNMEYGGMSRCATEDLSLKVTRWLDSNDVVQNLNIELNWDKQRVGPIRNLLKSDGKAHLEKRIPLKKEEDLEDNCYVPLLFGGMPESRRLKPVKRKKYFYRGVLVIWPKNHTPLMYCRYGMNSLLEEMEKSLNSANPEQVDTRKEVVLKLQKIVAFCCQEPNKAWNYGDSYRLKKKKKTMEKGELTLKLLRACITLKAREEGLGLLKALGSSFLSSSYYDKQKKFEGIQTEEVAEAIADFVHQVAGWDDCAELIKIIASPDRISEQLAPIIKLAQRLQDVGCLNGVKLIGECLVSSVVNCLNSEYLRYELLNGVASSFVWATLDSDLKVKILSACTKKVEELMAKVKTCLKPVPGAASSEERCRVIGLLHKMCSCCQFFILSEKNRFDPLQKSVVQEFHPLLSKLPILIVMHLILDIYKNESKSSPSIKDFPTLLEWYRTICKTVFSQNFFAAIDDAYNNKSEEIPSDIVKCLVWLNDEQTWQLFSQAMCRYTYQNNPFVRVLSKKLETLNAIFDSTLAFDAFVIIMDHWTKQLTTLKEPAFNWKQPNAELPRYPELQAFLRSDKEITVYSNFACIHEAKEFAEELEMKGLSNGFSVKVTTKGKRYSPRCTITKDRSFFSKQLLSFRATRLEMQKLSKQFNILYQNRLASTP